MPRKITLKAVQAQIRKLEARAEKLRQNEKPGIAELKAAVFDADDALIRR